MTFVITEPCIGTTDRSCVDVCPVDCIHPTKDEPPTNQLYIDPESCVDCNACVSTCPVGAIFDEVDLPAEYQHYLQVNADYYSKS